MPRQIVIASNNRHKIAELQQMLAESSSPTVRELEVASASALGLGPAPEIDETSDRFSGNARLKADGIAAWLQRAGIAEDTIVIADDSGLCVDALDGGPGVYSARYAGLPCDDEANNAKLVAQLRARGREDSPAHYVCVLAVRQVGERPIELEGDAATVAMAAAGDGTTTVILEGGCLCITGRCHGTVRVERRGHGGFGYDPYFWIDGGTRTFAELTATQKAARSHRGAAMRAFVALLPAL